jgi:lipopolysaccharide assembly outer membrane protein LptD (OstA)
MSATRAVLATLVALLLSLPGKAYAQPADSLAGNAPAAADPAAAAAPDSVAPAAPAAAVARPDTARVITTRAPAARRGARAPEPPYRIEADRMSGGRGPTGDVLLLEKVRITRSRTRLQSERGRYERATGMVYLDGNVRLRDSSATVTCDAASFSETEDRLDLRGNVVVVDREATLKAPFGWYDRARGIARLSGGVRGEERRQRLVADEAVYERDSMMVRARGNVIGDDDENRIRIEAGAVDFDRRTRLATATESPLMRARDDDGNETLLRARLLRVNALTRIAEAVDSVRVQRDTLRVSARHAVFDDSTGRGLLLGEPRAWDQETVLTGDTLETVAEDRRLERIIVHGNARIDYTGGRQGNRGETSRLSGRRVEMFVHESRMDSLIATGEARNAYTAVAQEGRTAEENQAQGDTIFVYFKDRKIDRARVQGRASGEYRPPVDVGDTTAARLERITYDGRRIEFVIPRNEIVLDGEAHLEYRDMELRSRRVVFDSEAKTLVAEGKPQLLEKDDEVSGHLMTYDMERRIGTIYEATTAYERGLYHGRRIRKAADDELDVLGGSYSTCDLEQPHYHFSARWMKIYLKDKLVAKPVVFYLRNVPILALPFYVFPIKPGRHSGFLFPQFEFGFNNRTGQFLRNAGYYWAPNDYFDVTTAGDYYQAQPAWLLRGEANYRLLYAFDGRLEGQFERNHQTNRDDYRFYGSHQQTLGLRTRLAALANFVSSREYSGSALSGQTLQQRLNRFLTSSLQVSHYADWISLNAFVDRRQDLDANVLLADPDGEGPLHGPAVGTQARLANLTVTAPSLSVALPTRALGSYAMLRDRPLGKLLGTTYLSLNGRFLSLMTRRGLVTGVRRFTNPLGQTDSVNLVGDTQDTRRAASSTFALADSRRLFGWINFSPSISGNAVVFDRDRLGNTVVPAAAWQSNAGLSTTLYRTVGTPVRGLGLRHIVTPAATVSYAPDFPGLQVRDAQGIVRDRFESFGDIGIFSGRRNLRAAFSVEQRLQAKLTRGDRVTRLDNLLWWVTSSSYDFLWRENGAAHPLGPVSTAVRLQPPGYVNADASASLDVYSQRPLRSFGYNVGSSFGSGGGGRPQAARLATESTVGTTPGEAVEEFRESWMASVAYSYAGGYAGPRWSSRQTVNGTFRYQLTENWAFDYQAGYDLTDRAVLLQRFNLSRRIHCWDATFSRTFTAGGEAEYYFRLGVREQREIFYERGTRVQSFGGIQ